MPLLDWPVMKTLMRQGAVGALLLAAVLTLVPTRFVAEESAAKRRLLERTATPYPALAVNMALQGVVKLDVLVAADGTVKTIETKGGHPVLVQAAMNAVRRWKWEPAARESHELVEVKYSPE